MKAFLLLLLLAMFGLCWGLQPGLEYHYRYSGRVASAITNVRQQFSAAGIQTDVTVQVAEDHSAIVKFSNVEVGDFHGDFNCDRKMPLPIEYHHLEEGVELLEMPFKITVNGSQVIESLEVPREPAWITNIRKSVINIFRIMPFVKDEDHSGDTSVRHDFPRLETTMSGYCTNWYTVMKLSEIEAAKENHEREQIMEVDEQRDGESASLTGTKGRKTSSGRKTSGHKGRKSSKSGRKGSKTSHGASERYSSVVQAINDTLWSVIRNVDFEECETEVTLKGHVKSYESEDLLSRSSVGTYLIRGDIYNMRIETAVVEGSITIFTQHDHEEHLDTFTNQTLELKVVSQIEHQLTIDYDDIITHYIWHYELADAVADEKIEGDQVTLEQILTGVELTEEIVTEIKGFIKTAIQELSVRMPRNPTHTNHLVGEISHVVEAIQVLSYQQLEEIYEEYVTEYEAETRRPGEFQKRKLFFLKQAMIAAGTEPAITFLLNKMTQPDFRDQDDETVYNFFSQITETIKSPSYITKIMDVVMQLTWNEREKDEKSTALVTFSHLLRKMCFNSERSNAYWYDTCQQKHLCPTDSIINTYIPYLQQGLEDEEIPTWYRLIYLQALSMLGTPHTINILQPYILGTKETHIVFRKNAILSLRKPYMEITAMGKVMELLMPVFENKAEYHEVRNIAFLVMATLEPSLSWWQMMAMNTWHEPSNKVANFISTTIQTTAHMEGGGELAIVASRVEHLAKPAVPASITHSLNYYMHELLDSNEFDHRINFGMLASTGADALIPSDIYFRLKMATFIGFTHDLQVNLEHFGGDGVLMSALKYLFQAKEQQPDRDAVDIIMGMFEELKENIGFEPNVDTSEKAILLKVGQVFKFIMAIDGEFFQDYDTTAFLSSVTRIINIPHYYRYVDAFVAIPTELGLPFIVKHTAQNAWWLSVTHTRGGESTLRPVGVKASTGITLDASNMFVVECKTLVPWSKKFAVGSVSENVISALLPFNVHHLADFDNYELQLTFEPITNDKVTPIDAHNFPATVQYGAFPTIAHHDTREVKIVKKADDYLYTRKTQALPSVLGLWIESEWTGDVQFPFNLQSFYKGEFNLFTPSLTAWDYHILYDPEASTTKSFTTTLTYVSTDKTLGHYDEVPAEFDTLGQETQGSVSMDYAQYSQFSQSSSSDYQDFGEIDSFAQEQQSSTRQRIAKLQQQVVPATGGHVRSVSVDFNLQGTPNKKYEAVLTWVTGIISSKSSTKFQFSWMQDVPQGILDDPHATCLNVELLKPHFLPFASMEDVLNTDFHATVKANLHDGVNCEQLPVLEIEGILDVSQEQLNDARKKLTEEHCGSTSDFHPIDLITSPIYDHVNFKANWREDISIQLKNLTYFAYDIYRGIKFPDISYDYTVTNPERRVEIDATKCLKTQHWTIHTTKPTEVSIIENIETPYLFDVIASPAHVKVTLLYDFINGRKHEACVIDHHKIRTFDGLEIPYELDECWKVLSIDTTGITDGTFMVRFHDGQWEARVMFPHQGLLLELTKTTLKVNGEDVSGHDDRYNVVFVDDGAILTLPFLTDSILKITDATVYFLEDQMYRSWLGGLCGNLDGEISAEMVGPKGCVYTDPELYVKSWTAPGEGCSGFSYLAKKRPVEAYQDACPHNSYVPTGVLQPNVLNECTDWEYQERIEGDFKCKSVVPTPTCKPGCHGTRDMTGEFEYYCETADVLNPDYIHCNPYEFSTTYPANCVHD